MAEEWPPAGIAPTDLPAREAQLGGFAIGSTLKGSLACEALMDDFQANNFARNIWSTYTFTTMRGRPNSDWIETWYF